MLTPAEQEQIRRDRKTLLRGAAALGVVGLGAAALLRKTKGGVVGALPRAEAPVKVVKPVGGSKGAFANSVHKQGLEKANTRMVKAAGLKSSRAWDALKPSSTKKLVRATPKDRETFAKLGTAARKTRATPAPVFEPSGKVSRDGFPSPKGLKPGVVTAKEASMADRGARQKARQDLLQFRKTKNLSTMSTPFTRYFKERDGGDTARDIAVGAGAVGSAGAAIHAARKLGKTADAAKQIVPRFTPQEIAKAVGAEVTSKTKKTLKGYFPTFIKGGKKVSALLKKSFENPESRCQSQERTKNFQTPASCLFSGFLPLDSGLLHHFGGRDQLKEVNSNRYVNPLDVAAGLRDAGVDQPLAHAQTVRAALRKGEKVFRVATRGGSLAKDVVQTVAGKPRGKDGAGRTKKREWEKSWFREGVKKAAVAGGVLGYVGLLRKSPKARAMHKTGVGWVKKKGNAIAKDLFPDTDLSARDFSVTELTPEQKKKAKAREERKTLNSARIRNTLVGATAGSFLGGGLHGGKSGYKGARVGAALGAAYGALSSPKRRAAIEQLQVASFSTPASRLIRFDAVANAAGWDVRDPRGKSARVFAPGSRKRERRPKEWHEKAENERKLWKAGVVAAGLAGLAGGAAVARNLPKAPANVIKVKFPKKVAASAVR